MAEEHKDLFEAVTLILAARGSCGSAALKPLLAICWGHQKQVNQHLHQQTVYTATLFSNSSSYYTVLDRAKLGSIDIMRKMARIDTESTSGTYAICTRVLEFN